MYGLSLKQKDTAIDNLRKTPIEGIPDKPAALNSYFNTFLDQASKLSEDLKTLLNVRFVNMG